MAKSTEHKKITLQTEPREVTGKKVKQLRKSGLIPGNVYGPNFKSVAVTVPVKDFITVYKIAHETGVVYVQVQKESHPTLIKEIQRHPLSGEILHIDFRKIDLKQKIETSVPVVLTGESEAVNVHGGVLLTQHDHLMVEALPEEIPSEISVDISALKEIGQDIKVSDLAKSSSYVITDEPDMVIVSVTAHKEESVTPETTSAAPEVITEKAPEEGEAPAEETKE